MLTCPGEDQLLRYARRRGDEPDLDLAEVSTHLETCADCQRRVETVSGNRNGQADALPTSDGRSRTPGTIDPPAAAGGDADWPSTASRAVDSRATVSSDLSPGGASREGEDQERGHGPVVPGYEVMERLGEGGMGVVYKARQLGLNRLVALKMIREDRQMRTGLRGPLPDRGRGGRAAPASQHHPDLRHRRGGRPPFVALELLEGGDLERPAGGQSPAGPGGRRAGGDAGAGRSTSPTRPGSSTATSSRAMSCLTADGVPKISDFGLAKRIGEDSGGPYRAR